MKEEKEFFNNINVKPVINKFLGLNVENHYDILEENKECEFIKEIKRRLFCNPSSLDDYLQKLNFIVNIIESESDYRKILFNLLKYLDKDLLDYKGEVYGIGVTIDLEIEVFDEHSIETIVFGGVYVDSKELAVNEFELIYLKIFESNDYNDFCCQDNYLTFLNIPSNVLFLDCDNNLLTTLKINDKLEEIMCSNNFIKNLIFTNINYLNMRNNTFNKLIFNKSVTIDNDTLDFLLFSSNINYNYIKLNNKKIDKIIFTKHKSLIIEKTFLL
jgi:hypothetical protein